MESKDLQIDMAGNYYVYILTNHLKTVLYIGVTSDLEKRLWEHNNSNVESFSKRYQTFKLVYFEQTTDALSAISREKQLKGWTRKKKDDLISKSNKRWKDLAEDLFQSEDPSTA